MSALRWLCLSNRQRLQLQSFQSWLQPRKRLPCLPDPDHSEVMGVVLRDSLGLEETFNESDIPDEGSVAYETDDDDDKDLQTEVTSVLHSLVRTVLTSSDSLAALSPCRGFRDYPGTGLTAAW